MKWLWDRELNAGAFAYETNEFPLLYPAIKLVAPKGFEPILPCF